MAAGCVDSLGSLRLSLLDAGNPWRILGKEGPFGSNLLILDAFHVAASALFQVFSARARSEDHWVEKGASSDAPAGAHMMAGCDGPSEAFRHPAHNYSRVRPPGEVTVAATEVLRSLYY